MKDEWKLLPLSSVSSESKNIKWKDIAKDKQYRYIDLTSVSREMKSITEPQLINKDNAPSRAQRIIQTDDILFATTRPTLRRFCIVPTAYDGQICSTGYCVIRPNKEEILPSWIFYLLSSDLFYDYIEPLQTGATYPAVTDTDVRGYLAPIPSLAEQQRIVDILDEAFEKIDVLKANAEQNLQDAKALFQAALRKELEPKDGWVRKPFTDICEITSSLVDPRIDEYRSLLHIGGANIESETGVLFDLKTAEEEGLTSGKFTFDSSMVLYNKIRPYLKKVARPNFSGLCSADMYPLSPLKGTSRDFLYYLLLSDDFTKYAVEGSPRTGMPKVNRACLFAYKCYVPSENEQRSIASRLDDLNDRCKVLQTNYDKTLTLCDDLKQALLRKAFNGEL